VLGNLAGLAELLWDNLMKRKRYTAAYTLHAAAT
jgi:hypothetical protein